MYYFLIDRQPRIIVFIWIYIKLYPLIDTLFPENLVKLSRVQVSEYNMIWIQKENPGLAGLTKCFFFIKIHKIFLEKLRKTLTKTLCIAMLKIVRKKP